MEGIKRRHLGEDAWRGLLRRFAQGDETVTAFCQREGLSANTFHRWRARLAMASDAAPRAASRSSTTDATISGFVDLGALCAPAPGAGRLELKLDLGGGVVLHVVRG